jgi:hypothetical protein
LIACTQRIANLNWGGFPNGNILQAVNDNGYETDHLLCPQLRLAVNLGSNASKKNVGKYCFTCITGESGCSEDY